MNHKLKQIFYLEVLFQTIFIYINLFINYYFWKNDQTLESLLLFNLLFAVFGFVGYSFGTLFLAFGKPKFSYFISSFASIFLFLSLFLNEYLSFFFLLFLASLFSGIVVGSFYSSTNHFLNTLSTEKDLKTYNAQIGYMMNLLAIFLPLAHSALIYFVGFGYSFAFMILISCLYIYFSTKITALASGNLQIFHYRDIKEAKYDHKMTLFLIITMIVSQLLVFLQPLLLFTLSKNELYISYLNLANVLLATLGLLFLFKIKSLNIKKQLIICTFFVMFSLLIFLLSENETLYFFSMILIVLSQLFYRYIIITIPFIHIKNVNERTKLILLWKREWWLLLGRAILLIVLYFGVKDIKSTFLSYIVLTCIFLSTISFFLVKKDQEKKRLN